ncbi:MAG: hypothetical protein IPI30_21365 [Saprospiraceae bacterium]|nr:hypothetical protein [Candidatus Vicinibacter affinis]
MKYFPNKLILTILATFSLTSCGNLSKEVENKLNDLKRKTESLDSIINKEVDKVLTLDSLINSESDKFKKLDSLINKILQNLILFQMRRLNFTKELLNN